MVKRKWALVTANANHAEKPGKFSGQNFKRWATEDVLLSHNFEPCALRMDRTNLGNSPTANIKEKGMLDGSRQNSVNISGHVGAKHSSNAGVGTEGVCSRLKRVAKTRVVEDMAVTNGYTIDDTIDGLNKLLR
ncbi:hypothetical protein Tco_0938587 [Tanacetum coccineum]|uniref:Transposase n=1 Tax=Tanacetum coccineum TaxID=301880 RepID=A0ABQ5DIG2_9ASTR